MIEILEHLQQYVPGARSAAELEQIQERFVCSCEFWQKIKVQKKCEYFTKDYYSEKIEIQKCEPFLLETN